MTEIADRYRRRADRFETRVAAVRPDQWDNQSPCEDWQARDVVRHIVDMHGEMLKPVGESLSPAPSVDQDPLAAYRAARADVQRALADPSLANRAAPTPAGMTQTVAEHVDQVVSDDLVIHGWDLARATGQDDTIDPDDVALMWAKVQQIPADVWEMMRTPGAFGPGVKVFGPEVEVAPDAPTQHKLLGLFGRDPH